MEEAASGDETVLAHSDVKFELKDDILKYRETLLSGAERTRNGGTLSATQSIDDSLKSSKAAIRVFTLNCWGLKFVSKFRLERLKAIAEFINRNQYNVVFLQEVGLNSDYEELAKRVEVKYPFSHYFDHGIIGSGTCIFSTARLQEANFHEFTINGYPTNFWHGDWFAAKGIGVCQVTFKGFDIHLYVSHYHANYNPKNDIYLAHRVSHALESAQWIKLASTSADLTIYAGDFNCTPTSLPYRLLLSIAPLTDSWECTHAEDDSGGETSETRKNSFTNLNDVNIGSGKRIDFIMYTGGPNIDAKATTCVLPVPDRVPGHAYSYSDHEGVEAVILMKRTNSGQMLGTINNQAASFRRLESAKLRKECVRCASEAINVMDGALKSVNRTQTNYLLLTVFLFVLLLSTFAPAFFLSDGPAWNFIRIDISMFFPRFIFTSGIVIFGLLGSLFSKRERNALVGTRKHLKMLLEQDAMSEQTSQSQG